MREITAVCRIKRPLSLLRHPRWGVPLLALFFFLLMPAFLAAQVIVMPEEGDTTVIINSTGTYTVYDPGGNDDYFYADSYLTIKSSTGRPFSLQGWYSIDQGHCLTIYQGDTKYHPIQGCYSGSGNVKIYCHSGAVTLHFLSDPSGVEHTGFHFTICSPEIYDVGADSVNSTFAHIKWNASHYYNFRVQWFQSYDTMHITSQQTVSGSAPNLTMPTLAPGTEYTYYVSPRYSYYGSQYYDTTDICNVPPHRLRTPKVANCNTCGHNRECIDYTDFYAEQVVCYKGSTYKPDSVVCVSPSQHNVKSDVAEYDPRTGNQLKPIPSGDTASVMLGNADATHGGESILYEIHVDTNDYDLMLLRYAMVFKHVITDNNAQKPRFSILLFDENCIPVQPLCYCREFMESSDPAWHNATYHIGNSYEQYVWRDWSALAIDLAPYHGRTLYLQLSTRDGIITGSAYAYFTLHCARKQVDHFQQCSDNVANTFYAPQGFEYRWYNAADPDSTLSTNIALSVADSGLYQCRVTPVDCRDASCGYTINALASPRYPHADFDTISTTESCSFTVRFVNRSFVTASPNDTVPLWTHEDCETAFWDFGNGQTSTNYNAQATYSEAGTYTVTLIVGIAGGACQDTITKQIHLRWAYDTARLEGETTLCAGHNRLNLTMYNTTSCAWSYTYNNHTFNTNNPSLTIPNVTAQTILCVCSDSNGCNYNFQIPIITTPVYDYNVNNQICQSQLNDGYTWRDTVFYNGTTSGTYTFNRQTVNSCDSVVHLHLTVLQSYITSFQRNYCDYVGHYTYLDSVFATPGLHTYTLTSTNGCDSIIQFNLNRVVAQRDTIREQTCVGYTYNQNNFTVLASETQTVGQIVKNNRTTLAPCDSFATLVLTVNPRTASTFVDTVPESQLPYFFNGVDFNNSVTDTVIHLANRYGCDSAIHFTLFVNRNVVVDSHRTVCSDALPYQWGTLTFQTAGTQDVMYQLGNGADSIVHCHLTVYPTYSNQTHDTICAGEQYTFCGDSYAAAGSYHKDYASVHGCDSVENLTLVVNSHSFHSWYDTICSNGVLHWNDSSYTTPGAYSQRFANYHGCDSTATLELTVKAVTQSDYYDTVVENSLPRSFNQHLFYTDADDSVVVVQNAAGCDSVIHYWLRVNWNSRTNVYDTVCYSQLPYTWDGTVFGSTLPSSPATSYTMTLNDTLASVDHSDSLVIRHLTIHPTYSNQTHDTICAGEQYTFCGDSYAAAGSYHKDYASIHGCDSVENLTLVVNSHSFHSWYDTICSNGVLHWNDSSYNTPGAYSQRFANYHGCDSTATLELTVKAVTQSDYYDTVVENSLPRSFNQHLFYTDADDSVVVVQNAAGCDSVIHYWLRVNWNSRTNVYDTVCYSQLPYTWDGTVFGSTLPSSPATSYTMTLNDTLASVDLSDSVVIRRLTVHPTFSNQTHDTICSDTSYPFCGTTYTASGTYEHQLHTLNQCDSVETLLLTVKAVTYSTLYDTVVENLLPHVFNDVSFADSVSGVAVVIANAESCDSIITYSLYVHRNVYDTVDSTVCRSALPLAWNHRTFEDPAAVPQHEPLSLTLDDTLMAATGADSLLTMRLHVNPEYTVDRYDTICSNGEAHFLDSVYNVAGTYPHRLSSVAGCDSVEVLHLTVFGTSVADIRDTIVENSLPWQFLDSLFHDSVLSRTFVVPNAFGCDSTISYSLFVHRNVSAEADSTVCQNAMPVLWNHRLFDGDSSAYDAAQRRFTLVDTLLAHTGADSVLTMNLTVDVNTYSLVNDTIVQNQLPYTYLDTLFADSTVATPFVVPNAKGCDSLITYTLFVYRNKTTNLDSVICENDLPLVWEGITFDTTTHPSLTIADVDVPPMVYATDTAIYAAAHGEDSLVVLHLAVKPNTRSILYDTVVENSLPHIWNGVAMGWGDTVAVDERYADLESGAVLVGTNGCDSLAAMRLHVWRNRTATADSVLCENFFPLAWNNRLFAHDTLFALPSHTLSMADTLATTHGADSMLTMTVTMHLNSFSSVADTILENQMPYDFNGYLFDRDNYAAFTIDSLHPEVTTIDTAVLIANVLGCDSLVSYSLSAVWNVHVVVDSTVCAGELPLMWNARTFAHDSTLVASVYVHSSDSACYLPGDGCFVQRDTLPAASGADSIVTMRLHVLPSYSTILNDTVCEAQSYLFYDDTLTLTGVYGKHFVTVDQCDSSEYLYFANFPNYNLEYYDTICDYSGVMRLGVEYIGMARMNTVHLCDSNEVYHLWGLPVSYSNVDTIISDHQLPFTYNGYTFSDTADAQLQLLLTNRYGCDSILNFTLTVMPTVRDVVDSSVCEELLPLDWDGALFQADSTATGSYVMTIIDTLSTIFGADSIVTRHLHVFPTYVVEYLDTTCNGDPYHFGDSLYNTSGVYTHYYTTTVVDATYGVACDSVETLTLQVNAMSYATVHDTIVENRLPYTFGGVTFTTTDEIVDSTIVILNTAACDSVITYSLHVLPNTYVHKDTSLCDNQLPFVWLGVTVNAAGHDSVVVVMPDGTDSVTRLHTVVFPSYDITDTVRSCDRFTWIDDSVYTQTTLTPPLQLSTVNGCDSLMTLRLSIVYSAATTDSILSCDPYTWIDEVTYDATVYGPSHTLQTVDGCDSVVTLHFVKADHRATHIYDTICKGTPYTFAGNVYTATGDYDDTLHTLLLCDSLVTLHLKVLEPYAVNIVYDYDCDRRTYTLTAQTDAPYFEWNSSPEDLSLTGQTNNKTILVKPQTHETYYFFADYADVPTCPSGDTVYLSPLLKPHAAIEHTPDFLTIDQPHLTLINRSTNDLTHRWWVDGEDYGTDTRISYFADLSLLPPDADSIAVTLQAYNGVCVDSAVVVVPLRRATIWAPNTITPDEDNNRTFFVRFTGITDYSVDLYTRSGVLVWHSDDMNDYWDGTYKGKPCPQATYVWIVHYRDITAPNNQLSKKGTVTLLR